MSAAIRWTPDQLAAYQKRGGARALKPLPAVPVVKVKKAERSELETEIERQLVEAGIFCRAEFHPLDGRNFRLDFAWPDIKCGVEVDGAVHRIKGRFKGDLEKGALLLLAGWRVLHVGRDQIYDGRALTWIKELLNG